MSSLIQEDAFSDNEEFDNCVTQLDNSSPFSDDEEFLRSVSQFENSSLLEKADVNFSTLSSPQLENLRRTSFCCFGNAFSFCCALLKK